MKIVLFGPTGMIGSRIAAELARRGHEVVGASRASGTDITHPAQVAAAAAGADAVVCTVSARGATTRCPTSRARCSTACAGPACGGC